MQIRLRTPVDMRAEQLRLDAENVAIPAAEMEHRFNLGLLLNQLASHLCAQPGAGTWAVRHVDAIDAVVAA